MNRTFQVWLVICLAVGLSPFTCAVAGPSPLPVTSLAELEEALEQARGNPKVVRVRADWSVSDSELDKQFASACLQSALSEVVWVEWDVTANSDADRQFLEKYEVFGPPTFLLFDASGNHLKGRDVVGYLPAEEIVATLTEVFELPTQSRFADCRATEGAANAKSWDELIDESYKYLYDRQEALEASFRLSEHDRWDIDQDMGTLTFSDGDVPVAEAKIAIVGTFLAAHGVWRWSWTNPSIDPKLSAPIDIVRRYGAEHRMEKLTDKGWPAEEVDGWEMAAIANYLLQGKGVYRAPAGDLLVFVVITDIRKVG